MLLSSGKRKEAFLVLENYSRAYCCKRCRIIYGSDLRIEDGYCPRCSSKLKRENK
jgi:uncharacterized paraquat-inducible protein A